MTARAETALAMERERGKLWCDLKGVTFVDINELGVWYDRTITHPDTNEPAQSRGCASWAEVTGDLQDHFNDETRKYQPLSDEAAELEARPSDPQTRDEL